MSVAKKAGAFGLLVLGAALAAVGQPTPARRLKWLRPEIERQLRNREVQIDPGELMDLRYNRGLRLYMFDVRPEVEYNVFHLWGADYVPPEKITPAFVKRFPQDGVKVVMSDDEKAATAAWTRLRACGMLNVYILGGGVNLWLDIYKNHHWDAQVPVPPVPADTFRHWSEFDKALCSCYQRYYDFARPNPHHVKPRKFVKKVKIKVVEPPKGGCGA